MSTMFQIFMNIKSNVAQFRAGGTEYQPEISILDPVREGNGNSNSK